jgi:hypothetical protein
MVLGFGGGKQGWIANLGHGKHPPLHSMKTINLTEQASLLLSIRMI